MSYSSVLRSIFTPVFAILLSAVILTGCGKKAEEESQKEESSGESKSASSKNGREEWVQKMEANVKVFRAAKAEKAASCIAERFPEGKVAFLIEEVFYNDPESEYRIVLDEIRKRLSEKGISCDDVLTIRTGGDETAAKKAADPEEAFAKDLNTALADVQNSVDIVVNFAGLPKSDKGFQAVRFLRGSSASGRNNMLLMTDTGLDFIPREMIRSRRVCAILDYVTPHGPGCEFDITKDTAPKDLAEAFDYLYFFLDDDSFEGFDAGRRTGMYRGDDKI